MTAWWIALGTAGQVFACIAIPATVMLIIQMILTLIGMGGDEMDADTQTDGADVDGVDGVDTDVDDGGTPDDADTDIADGGLRVFTLRGLIAFFSVTGWVGTICCEFNLHLAVTILISVASGLLAMFAVAALMKWLLKLQYDGTEDIKEALGVSGTVYMRVPPARSGKGKVNVIIQGKLSEKDAVTDEETVINRDEEITVIGISGGETLIVRRKNRK